jgi:hypothetical protein
MFSCSYCHEIRTAFKNSMSELVKGVIIFVCRCIQFCHRVIDFDYVFLARI